MSSSDGLVATKKPTCLELATAFAWITFVAFGGGAPWVKRIAVDERGWLTLEEFAEVLSLAQSLPGAVFFNLAITIGIREQGIRGALSTFCGVLFPALCVGCSIERLQAVLDANSFVHHALGGVVAAAAGLFASTAIQMSRVTLDRLGLWGLVIALLVTGITFVLHVALPVVVVGILPLGMFLAWHKR